MEFTEEDALQAYAQMLATLSVGPLANKLAEDFHHSAASGLDKFHSKNEYLANIRPRLESLKRSGSVILTRLGYWRDRPCLMLARGSTENYISTVFAKVRDGLISEISLQDAPPAKEVEFKDTNVNAAANTEKKRKDFLSRFPPAPPDHPIYKSGFVMLRPVSREKPDNA